MALSTSSTWHLYTIHLQSNCKVPSGVFKTLLNNSKTWRNFRYANMFSTGFHPHKPQNLTRNWTFCEDCPACEGGKVWLWSSVSVLNSLAIRQLSKKAVTVVHFEILANGAKPNQIGCEGGSLSWLVAFRCHLWASSMMNTCQSQAVTSMQNPCHPLNDLCSWGGLHSSLLFQLCF